jgi:hypothetical protein
VAAVPLTTGLAVLVVRRSGADPAAGQAPDGDDDAEPGGAAAAPAEDGGASAEEDEDRWARFAPDDPEGW